MVHRSLAVCSIFLVLSWLIANHYPPWVASHSELLAALAALALAMAGLTDRSPLRVGAVVFFLVCVAAIPLFQAAAGEIYFFGDAWIAALYVFAVAWCALWSERAAQFHTRLWSDLFGAAVVLGAVLSSAIAMLQQFRIDTGALTLFLAAVPPGHTPFANLAQPNQLMTLLGLGLASTLFLFERRRLAAPVAFAIAMLLIITMAMTQSRTALLLFGVAIAWTVWFQRQLCLRTPWSVPLALGGLWATLFVIWPGIVARIGLAPVATLAQRLEAGPRTVIWSQLWDASWMRWWQGWGWNQISVAQMAVAANGPRTRLIEHSHNLLLDLIVWNGWPLAAALIGVSGWWLVRSVGRLRSLEGAFGLLLMTLLLTHAMVEFPLDYLYFLVPFGIALGLMLADCGDATVVRLSRRTGAWLTLFVAAIVGAGSVDYWHVEEAYRDLRFTMARIGPPRVLSTAPPMRTQFTQLQAFYQYSLLEPRPDIDASQLQWIGRVAHRFGYVSTLYKYALTQAYNGDLEGARKSLQQLRQLHGERLFWSVQNEIKLLAVAHPELRALLPTRHLQTIDHSQK